MKVDVFCTFLNFSRKLASQGIVLFVISLTLVQGAHAANYADPSIPSTLCSIVTDNDSRAEQSLTNLFQVWISEYSDDDSLKEFLKIISESDQPVNPFANGISVTESQISTIVDKVIGKLSPREWSKIQDQINQFAGTELQVKNAIVQIDEVTSTKTELRISYSSPHVENHKIDGGPNVVTFPNGETYIVVSSREENQRYDTPEQIFLYRYDRLNGDLELKSEVNYDFQQINEDLNTENAVYAITPPYIPIDDYHFIAFFREKASLVVEIDIRDGSTTVLGSIDSMKFQDGSFAGVAAVKDGFAFANFKTNERNKDNSIINFGFIDLKKKQVSVLAKMETPLIKSTIQVKDGGDGNLYWFIHGADTSITVVTMSKDTREFTRSSKKIHLLKSLMANTIHKPVIFLKNDGDFLIATGLENDFRILEYKTRSNELIELNKFAAGIKTRGKFTFFEDNQNLHLVTMTSSDSVARLTIFLINPHSGDMKVVSEAILDQELGQAPMVFRNKENRIFFLIRNIKNNFYLYDFDPLSHSIVPLGKLFLPLKKNQNVEILESSLNQFSVIGSLKDGELTVLSTQFPPGPKEDK